MPSLNVTPPIFGATIFMTPPSASTALAIDCTIALSAPSVTWINLRSDMNHQDLNERMNRLKSEITKLREYAIMQLAVMQCIALKMGIAPQQMSAFSPRPIPSPFDLMDSLKR